MSNLIKSSHYIPINDKKTIHIPAMAIRSPKQDLHPAGDEPELLSDQAQESLDELEQLRQQIMRDAEEAAEARLQSAEVEAAERLDQANKQIDEWWKERREQDEEQLELEKARGFEQGYEEGLKQAEAKVLEQYAEQLQEAKLILQDAVERKSKIIQDAEPFLIEMSCQIAQKIIDHQLTISKEWVVDLIKHALSRKREQGLITLCVSPAQYTDLQGAIDELKLAIDSQAELQIIPDSSIEDHGCIVRSSLGSIDARIDTQLQEIKDALIQIAMSSEADEIDE